MYLVNSLFNAIAYKIYGSTPSENSAEIMENFSKDIWHEIFKNLSIFESKGAFLMSKKVNKSLVNEFSLCKLFYDKIKPSFIVRSKRSDSRWFPEMPEIEFYHFKFPDQLVFDKTVDEECPWPLRGPKYVEYIAKENNADIIIIEKWDKKTLKISEFNIKEIKYFNGLELGRFIHNWKINLDQKNQIKKVLDYINDTALFKKNHYIKHTPEELEILL